MGGLPTLATVAVLLLFAQPAAQDDSAIMGFWSGTATAGGVEAGLAFEIKKLPDGIGLYMTLPRLHAWRMPVDYVTAQPDGTWAVPSWHITVRREGGTLTGTYGHPRVRL